jgi:hypothetical protein
MLITPHAVAGATIGALVRRPLIAIPLAIASHYTLDRVPHWQETLPPYTPHAGTWIRAPLDATLAFYLVHLMGRTADNSRVVIWIAAVSSTAPDLDSLLMLGPQLAHPWKPIDRYIAWHIRIQRETRSLWGLAPQAVLVAVCLWLARER